ncbi:MAG: cyclic nucleotide-binding domain-containing protein [Thermoanaerobaculia bacterium]
MSYIVSSSEKPHRLIEVEADRLIFREGDLGTDMFIIQEGRVEILQEVSGEERRIAVLERGDFFGEMALLEELPRSASARTLTPVKLVTANGAAFDSMLRRNPEIAVRIMRRLSRRLRDTDRLLKEALDALDRHHAKVAAQEGQYASTRISPTPAPAVLVHQASGSSFQFGPGSTTTIGRRDPVTGIRPNIDLTEVDLERSCSRRHAKVYLEGERFYLVEDLATTNGTFVNGARLSPGVPVEIRSGDALRFGIVEFTFQID